MSNKVKTEWHDSPEFAEVAEALGINTIDVMAMLPDQIVLFTPHPNDADPMIYKARLGRDADNILRAGKWIAVAPSSAFKANVEALMKKAMEEIE